MQLIPCTKCTNYYYLFDHYIIPMKKFQLEWESLAALFAYLHYFTINLLFYFMKEIILISGCLEHLVFFLGRSKGTVQ